jgi:hypothetical protein
MATKSSKNKLPIIAFHGCSNEFQDRKYGPNQRVFNHAPGNKYAKPDRYRCTVCGKEK